MQSLATLFVLVITGNRLAQALRRRGCGTALPRARPRDQLSEAGRQAPAVAVPTVARQAAAVVAWRAGTRGRRAEGDSGGLRGPCGLRAPVASGLGAGYTFWRCSHSGELADGSLGSV